MASGHQKLSSLIRRNITWWRATLSPTQRWFVIILASLWLVTSLVVGSIIADRSINQTNAQNAARLRSLQSAIANLPSFSSVKIGETSGTIPYVQQTREDLLSAINHGDYSPQYPLFIYALHPNYWLNSGNHRSTKAAIVDIKNHLEKTIKNCKSLGKFIAYSPTIDLKPSLDTGSESYRLERTKVGLEQTQSSLLDSGLPHAAQLIRLLDQQIADTLQLRDETKIDWSEKITNIQKTVLDDMQKQDIMTSNYAKTLSEAAETYQ